MKTVHFYIGVDLGQSADFTAISIIEQVEDLYKLRHLERLPLGTSYIQVVERIKKMQAADSLKGKSTLIVDATGVGAPVIDMMRGSGLWPIAITITGGDTAHKEGNNYRVPKRDLISNMQVLFQNGGLKIAEGLSHASIFVQELLNFKVKINVKTAHDSYEAWREGVHDDLVLSVSLACWYPKNERQPNIRIL